MSAAVATVSQSGVEGTLAGYRDDYVILPFWDRPPWPYYFVEVRPGGWDPNDGAAKFRITSDPRIWRVVEDCESGRTFKLFGFQQTEFDALMDAADIHVGSADSATCIADFFVEQVAFRTARVLELPWNLRLFATEQLADRLVGKRTQKRLSAWIAHVEGTILSGAAPVGARREGDGWAVTLLVAEKELSTKKLELARTLNVRRIRLTVSDAGSVSIRSDVVVSSFVDDPAK
jgi:hypothetical protein